MLHARPALYLLASLVLLGCGRRQAPVYAEPAPCPYDGADPEPYQPDPSPSSPGSEPVRVSPASFEAPAAPKGPPSCEAHEACQGESCCTRIELPAGVLLEANGQRVDVEGYALDKYELTVGRVRAWAERGAALPSPGTVVGRRSDGSPVLWQAEWRAAAVEGLASWDRYDTYRTGQATLPKNFLDAYTAMAVCAFDGGRLPSDAEWRYAARGGEEARRFPWGSESISPEHAVYNCGGDGDPSCSLADLLPVGSKARGAGRWGHMDLAGSVFEWTADAVSGEEAISRGGGFCYIGGVDRRARAAGTAENHRRDAPHTTSHMVGARCAYDLPGDARVVTASR